MKYVKTFEQHKMNETQIAFKSKDDVDEFIQFAKEETGINLTSKKDNKLQSHKFIINIKDKDLENIYGDNWDSALKGDFDVILP